MRIGAAPDGVTVERCAGEVRVPRVGWTVEWIESECTKSRIAGAYNGVAGNGRSLCCRSRGEYHNPDVRRIHYLFAFNKGIFATDAQTIRVLSSEGEARICRDQIVRNGVAGAESSVDRSVAVNIRPTQGVADEVFFDRGSIASIDLDVDSPIHIRARLAPLTVHPDILQGAGRIGIIFAVDFHHGSGKRRGANQTRHFRVLMGTW